MQVSLIQHPVGQGGMMSGLLESAAGRFHWVYDCGSNQVPHLNREIGLVTGRGDVDVLFLSHLDSDHVNGIDRLLSRVQVTEVVLPYLAPTDRLIAVAHDLAAGTASGSLFAFLADSDAWLAERGVQQITYVTPHDEDDDAGPEGPGLPEPGGNSEDSALRPHWSNGHRTDATEPGAGQAGKQRTLRVRKGASLQLGAVDWVWVPFAHRPSAARLSAFESAVEAVFPNYRQDPRIIQMLMRDPLQRKILRNCYDRIWSDHNLVSMALYAGPVRPGSWSYWWSGPYARGRMPPNDEAGWLATGDMALNVHGRRNAFLSFYRRLLDRVNVFVLPHHGAEGNFDPSLIAALPNTRHFVAACGSNSYGHPGKSVKRAILHSGNDFIKVTSRGGTALTWMHGG